ncbi:hypothetical protein T439DRAFT_333312 [Meredithblackwellia eburnea MCA 4105]
MNQAPNTTSESTPILKQPSFRMDLESGDESFDDESTDGPAVQRACCGISVKETEDSFNKRIFLQNFVRSRKPSIVELHSKLCRQEELTVTEVAQALEIPEDFYGNDEESEDILETYVNKINEYGSQEVSLTRQRFTPPVCFFVATVWFCFASRTEGIEQKQKRKMEYFALSYGLAFILHFGSLLRLAVKTFRPRHFEHSHPAACILTECSAPEYKVKTFFVVIAIVVVNQMFIFVKGFA